MTPDAHERRRAFCARLKGERERRATSLASIAEATKIKASLLDAFERGDVSRWPKGIYRRAFFRDYITAIGLSADLHVDEFVELFPDGEEPPPSARPMRAPVVTTTAPPMRLMLDEGKRSSTILPHLPGLPEPRAMARNAVAAIIDFALISGCAYAVSRYTGNWWSALGIVSSVYLALGTILFGRSPMSTLVGRINMPIAAGLAPVERKVSSAMPDLAQLGDQVLRGGSVVRELISRLATTPAANAKHQRELEMLALRQRRAETANGAVDEVSEVLG